MLGYYNVENFPRPLTGRGLRRLRRTDSPRVIPASHYGRVVAHILCNRPCDRPISSPDVYADSKTISYARSADDLESELMRITNGRYGQQYQKRELFYYQALTNVFPRQNQEEQDENEEETGICRPKCILPIYNPSYAKMLEAEKQCAGDGKQRPASKRKMHPPPSPYGTIGKDTKLPAIGKPSYTDANGKAQAIRPGTGRAIMSTDRDDNVHSSGTRGYRDKSGKFHVLKPGENIPRGVTASGLVSNGKLLSTGERGFIDSNGKFQVLRPGPGDKETGRATESISRSRNVHTRETTAKGYREKSEKFRDQKNGNNIPHGVTTSAKLNKVKHQNVGYNGSVESNKKLKHLRPVSGDAENDVASGFIERDRNVHARGTKGYLDKSGKFRDQKVGENIPQGVTASGVISDGKNRGTGETAFINSNEKFQVIRPGDKESGKATGSIDRDRNVLARETTATGYRDKSGKFRNQKFGQNIPRGVTTSAKLKKVKHQNVGHNGSVESNKKLKLLPPVSGDKENDVASGSIERDRNVHAIETKGYLDKSGKFRDLKAGENIPRGVTASGLMSNGKHEGTGEKAFIDSNGKFQLLRPGNKESGGATGSIDTDRNVHAKENTTTGYRKKSGKFRDQKVGENIRRGVTASVNKGKIQSVGQSGFVESNKNLQLLRPGPGDEENDVASGSIERDGTVHPRETMGYRDKSGKFHVLKPGQNVPHGATPSVLVNKQKLQSTGETSFIDSNGKFQVLRPGDEENDVASGSIVRNGKVHPGETTALRYRNKSGKFRDQKAGHNIPRGVSVTPSGMVISGTLQDTDETGFIDSNGKFQLLRPGPGDKESGKATGSIDRDRNVHARETTAREYKQKSGKLRDQKAGHNIPRGVSVTPSGMVISGTLQETDETGFIDSNGKFQLLRPRDKESGRATGSIDRDRNVHARETTAREYKYKSRKLRDQKAGHNIPRGVSVTPSGMVISGTLQDTDETGFIDSNGKFQLLRPGDKESGGATGPIDRDRNVLARETTAGEFKHKSGKLRDQTAGQNIPRGVTASALMNNGKQQSVGQSGFVESSKKLQLLLPGPGDEENDVASGSVERDGKVNPIDTTGYLDKSRKFRDQKAGHNIPRGVPASGLMSNGKHQGTGERAFIDSNGKLQVIRPEEIAPRTSTAIGTVSRDEKSRPGDASGYLDIIKPSNFPGQNIPPSSAFGRKDGNGEYHPTGPPDAPGNFQTQRPVESTVTRSLGTDGWEGNFMHSRGKFQVDPLSGGDTQQAANGFTDLWNLPSSFFKKPIKAIAIPPPERILEHIESTFTDYDWPRGKPMAVRHYPNGRIFCAVFENGSGEVFYPHGGLAIVISNPEPVNRVLLIRDPYEKFYFMDQAIFCDLDCNGSGVVFDSDGVVSLQYNSHGGFRLEGRDGKTQTWTWNRGGQRIILKLNNYMSLKVLDQDSMNLVFNGNQRGVRFNVGPGRIINLMNVEPDHTFSTRETVHESAFKESPLENFYRGVTPTSV